MTRVTEQHQGPRGSAADAAAPGAASVRTSATPPRSGARPRRAVVALSTRLIRRGALALSLAVSAYLALEVVSFRVTYPDGVPPQQFSMFEDNPAVRMMQGVPQAIETAGGFTVWDGGWIIQLILAVWALLATTRLLRGEEDLERTDLILAGPIRVTRATGLAVTVLFAAALLVGLVATVTMVVSGTALDGSLWFGLGLVGVTATFVGVAAVTSQLVQVRRRAAALAAGVLGVAYVLRMVGEQHRCQALGALVQPAGVDGRAQPVRRRRPAGPRGHARRSSAARGFGSLLAREAGHRWGAARDRRGTGGAPALPGRTDRLRLAEQPRRAAGLGGRPRHVRGRDGSDPQQHDRVAGAGRGLPADDGVARVSTRR